CTSMADSQLRPGYLRSLPYLGKCQVGVIEFLTINLRKAIALLTRQHPARNEIALALKSPAEGLQESWGITPTTTGPL
ncbi:MAG: hypothetical protein JJU32_15775, partial [Phormidium sp. BM_Day4_Bin.17]|nr:hypothetical protein [Phormidium sp. BM_Day4_Bin.17]